jgi:TldD protein
MDSNDTDVAGILEYIVEKSFTQVELRYCHRNMLTLQLVNESSESDISSHEGVSVRVLVDGSLGFSSTNEVTPRSIEEAVKRAVKASRAVRNDTTLQETELACGTFCVDETDPVTTRDIEEKVHLVSDSQKLLEHPDMKVKVCGYSEICDHKFIVTSDGARAEIIDNKLEFSLSAYIHDVQGKASCGATGGWGDLFAEETPEDLAARAVKRADQLSRARYCKAGKYTVILDPGLVGLMAHEAVGHLCEADYVLGGAVTRDILNTQVASPLVTITDTGTAFPHACGTTLVDDEGVPARDIQLIRNGVLTGFLHNRKTASIFGLEPTGNARAFEFDCEPLIRMRNTVVESGDWTVEEMLEDVTGYLLVGSGEGESDTSGTFMFQVKEVYPVHKGEVGDPQRGASVAGNAFEVLHSVDATGKEVTCALPSMYCWKGQIARVDGGGPYVRCTALIGGRS